MATQPVSTADAQRFYRVGVLGLRVLQDRGLGAERFGPDASARWRAYRGELNDSHRLDLLLRDGAATHPLAFAPRAIFGLLGLAHDEPFGPEWVSLTPNAAGSLLHEAEGKTPFAADAGIAGVLGTLADTWGLQIAAVETSVLDKVGAASRLVTAGASALVALAAHMAGRPDMDFGDQVLVVTDSPGVRQLAGLAAALTGSRAAPRQVRPRHMSSSAGASAAAALGFDRATQAVITNDAGEREAAAARALAAELGATELGG